MNPFDMTGPDFLFFYLFFFLALWGLLAIWRRRLEVFPMPKVDTSEPYLIAYLRGGQAEMVRAAVISLVDRGYLIADGPRLTVAPSPPGPPLEHPFEFALIEACRDRTVEATGLLEMEELKAISEGYRARLTELRLLPDREVRGRRLYVALLGMVVLFGVASIKLHVAAERGRHNTGILEVLRLAAPVVCFILVLRPKRTRTGDLFLKDLKSLCETLSEPRPETGGRELLLLIAVFGVSAVSTTSHAFAKELFPRATNESGNGNGNGSWSWGCSSGCGSGCGSGGGGGDGGGGGCGGGGCGGCGG